MTQEENSIIIRATASSALTQRGCFMLFQALKKKGLGTEEKLKEWIRAVEAGVTLSQSVILINQGFGIEHLINRGFDIK